MKLLRELTRLQAEHGCLKDETLKGFSEETRVPLYRLEELVSFYPHFRRIPSPRISIHLCRDICCAMAGCGALSRQLHEQFQNRDDIEVHEVSCLGRCESAPAVAINETPLTDTLPVDLAQIRAWVENPNSLPENRPTDAPRNWKCDPYRDGKDRFGTVKSLFATGTDISTTCIQQLKASNLRGMGGAGFPTGLKWELVSKETAQPKYVICNADESEPGTFKDRVILEELPHLVIEGMLLAGLTIGAEQGIIFIRHEYAREQQAIEAALQSAREQGILGDNAAGSGKKFDVDIFVSPGGYILGEETALLEALEDKRGEPRNKPPYPGTQGLWGKPTLINNVETFALATSIIHHGKEWWEAQGAEKCSGLKFVSISGDVEQPGVYEISIGISVNELIELAGGMKGGKRIQAFLPGGASSNFLPASAADTPLEFEAMKQAGSMLGTGAVIVISEGRDLFSLATNLVRFFRNESCGKCVPCRVGSEKSRSVIGRGTAK